MVWQSFFFTASLSVTLQTSTLLSNSNVSGDMSRSCNQPYIIHVAVIILPKLIVLCFQEQHIYSTRIQNNATMLGSLDILYIFGNTECRDI